MALAFPAAQSVHVLLLVALWLPEYFPAEHSVQCVAPASAKVPGPHPLQVLLVEAPICPEAVPAGQGIGSTEKSGQ